MVEVSTCPDERDLKLAWLRQLPADQLERIDAHLLDCRKCLDSAANVEPELLVAAVRTNPALAECLARHRPDLAAGFNLVLAQASHLAETLTSDRPDEGLATCAADGAEFDHDESIDFLGIPTRTG